MTGTYIVMINIRTCTCSLRLLNRIVVLTPPPPPNFLPLPCYDILSFLSTMKLKNVSRYCACNPCLYMCSVMIKVRMRNLRLMKYGVAVLTLPLSHPRLCPSHARYNIFSILSPIMTLNTVSRKYLVTCVY